MNANTKMLGHEPNIGEIAAKIAIKLRKEDPTLSQEAAYDRSFTLAMPKYQEAYRAFRARAIEIARPALQLMDEAAALPQLAPYDADAERARLVTKFRAEGQSLESACVLASAKVQAKLTKRAMKLAKKIAKASFGKQKRKKDAVDAYKKADPLAGAPAPETPNSAKRAPMTRPMRESFVPAGATGIDVLSMGGLAGLPTRSRARDFELDELKRLSDRYRAEGMPWEEACQKAHRRVSEKKTEAIETAQLRAASARRMGGAR